MHSRSLLAALFPLVVACGGQSPAQSPPPTTAKQPATATPEAPVEPVNLEDPRLVQLRALADELALCTEPSDSRESCPRWEEFLAFDWAAPDAPVLYLFALVGSPNPVQRQVAAYAVTQAKALKRYPELATRVLDVMEKETDDMVAAAFAPLIDELLANPKNRERLYALIEHHTNPGVRSVLVDALQYDSKAGPLLLRMFDAAEPEVQESIVRAATFAAPEVRCGVYEKAFATRSSGPGESALINLVSVEDHCPKQWDAAIAWLETSELSKTTPHFPDEDEDMDEAMSPEGFSATNSIGDFCGLKVSAAQRARLLMQAKRFSKPEGPPELRVNALKSVLLCDPKAGRAFVKLFTGDSDDKVAEAARKLLGVPPQASAKSTQP
ncbi:MAG: hypothetical protein H6718_07665 [Polyangiaceae bacterium]|nr:hypothetical protein [Polyangiaceae bacterium]